MPGVDPVKAELVRRECAQKILDRSGDAGDAPIGWRRWAHTVLTPKVDYMATIRHAVRKALRDSTLGRYDRTYRRPHRRQAAYGEFIMSSFHQPRPRPGFLIDTSASMQDTQLARAVAELGGLTRQLGYSTEVVVACCDAAVHDVKKGVQRRAARAVRRRRHRHRRRPALVHRSQEPARSICSSSSPIARHRGRRRRRRFPVITIRVGDGAPPPWGDRGANKVITIEEPKVVTTPMWNLREQRWQRNAADDSTLGWMAVVPDMRPWGRRPLTIPPNSTNAWIQLAIWEIWMGMLIVRRPRTRRRPHRHVPQPHRRRPGSHELLRASARGARRASGWSIRAAC